MSTIDAVGKLGFALTLGSATTLGSAATLDTTLGVTVRTLGTEGVMSGRTLGTASNACCWVRGVGVGGEQLSFCLCIVVAQS